MRTLNNFCQSADLEPTEAHVPYMKGIDIPPGAWRTTGCCGSTS
jgi:hypothetical protein